MKARRLLEKAALGPAELAILYEGFDKAWEVIKSNYATSPQSTEVGRLRLSLVLSSMRQQVKGTGGHPTGPRGPALENVGTPNRDVDGHTKNWSSKMWGHPYTLPLLPPYLHFRGRCGEACRSAIRLFFESIVPHTVGFRDIVPQMVSDILIWRAVALSTPSVLTKKLGEAVDAIGQRN